MCHQPFAETHGLPEVWKTGDMGEQNDEVRAVMEKYNNVFFINGHLHGGIFEKIGLKDSFWTTKINGEKIKGEKYKAIFMKYCIER